MFSVCALQTVAPMQVYGKVYGDRDANSRPIGHDGKRDWTYGSLNCFDTFGISHFSYADRFSPFITSRL